jgi:hypothetical protein
VIQERDEHGRVVKSAGRRPGSWNKRACTADLLPTGALPTLYARTEAGDVQALRLLLDRRGDRLGRAGPRTGALMLARRLRVRRDSDDATFRIEARRMDH